MSAYSSTKWRHVQRGAKIIRLTIDSGRNETIKDDVCGCVRSQFLITGFRIRVEKGLPREVSHRDRLTFWRKARYPAPWEYLCLQFT